ncbi:competence/damage-inducible protein A [Mycolicibacterium sp.]|uniref:competence/damage-inducible protein A n=1 Tax=Mycolicibacterium sp. TaxID=2320850 RepID=UPI003D0C9C4A
MSARAGIVVTGTEVLTGRVQDRNGPWLADRLLELGVELGHITLCGDRPADIEAQLRFLAAQGVDLIVTSGGLGPTADDMTVEVVARFCGRELVLDEGLEATIDGIVTGLMARFPGMDPTAVRAANRKQALVPAGAVILEPVGTAPGVVVPGHPTVVVLPGPPRELQPMWRAAVATDAVASAIAGRTPYRQETVRMFGLPESALADTLRVAERSVGGFDRLEITTCLRRGELEIVTRYEPQDAAAYSDLLTVLRDRHAREIFSEDGALVDDQVAGLLTGRTIATAESCTGGMLAARLTDRAGSSSYVAGGVVAYSNTAKVELLGVDAALIDRHGAVSEPVAEAMARGALRRFGADTAVGITGIAGPGGGTETKPVGTVCFAVAVATGGGRGGAVTTLTRTSTLPGNRADVRERSTTVAMHLLRRVLSGEG